MTLTAEQIELRAVVRAIADTAIAKRIAPDEATAPNWALLGGELGLAGIAIPEEYGGAGGSYSDLAVVSEQLGYGLVASPMFATAGLAAPVLLTSGDRAAAARWLPRIAAGSLAATVVSAEHSTIRAQHSASGWRVSGAAALVIEAESAHLLLVSGQTDTGPGLFAVEAPAAGAGPWTWEPLPALDPSRPLSRLDLDDVAAERLDCDAVAVLRSVAPIWRTMLAAEQVGGTQRCLDMAVDYAKTRVQFGRPIGSFQSIKHLCADMLVDLECARALVLDAAAHMDQGPVDDAAALCASMAGAAASEAFVAAAERSAQIHGGISYTWEHDCHRLLRRARSSERLLTSVRDDYATVAALIGASATPAPPEGARHA